MTLTNAEAAARVARRNEAVLPDKPQSYLRHQNVSRLKSDPMTNGRSLGIEMIHIVPAAVPLDPMESRTVVAGAETDLAGVARAGRAVDVTRGRHCADQTAAAVAGRRWCNTPRRLIIVVLRTPRTRDQPSSCC